MVSRNFPFFPKTGIFGKDSPRVLNGLFALLQIIETVPSQRRISAKKRV